MDVRNCGARSPWRPHRTPVRLYAKRRGRLWRHTCSLSARGRKFERADGAPGLGVGIHPVLTSLRSSGTSKRARPNAVCGAAYSSRLGIGGIVTARPKCSGAGVVPINAQTIICGPADVPNECWIKGNLLSKGGCIHFQPRQLDCARLDMSKHGRRWFCSEKEAEGARCRAARR